MTIKDKQQNQQQYTKLQTATNSTVLYDQLQKIYENSK